MLYLIVHDLYDPVDAVSLISLGARAEMGIYMQIVRIIIIIIMVVII